MTDDLPPGLGSEDASLLARLPDALWAVNGVPTAATAARRETAAKAVAVVFRALPSRAAVRTSPLGAAWSTDIDVHLDPVSEVQGALEDRGWIVLDPLLDRIGSRGRDRWAIVEEGEVVGRLDVHRSPVPDPAEALVLRSRRRGEVRVREVLELRALLSTGHVELDGEVASAAADVEAFLGGTALARWRSGELRRPPARIPRLRRRRPRRPRPFARRVVVAVSGVDGSGKSTLVRELTDALGAAAVDHAVVWSRPGMRLGVLDRAARAARRVLRQGSQPALHDVAAGTPADAASRRGLVGAAWATLVTVAYVVDVWRQHLRTAGVVIYDRHAADAVITLEFVYRGVDLRLPRLLVRRLLPRPAVHVYVDVPAEIAVRRKPNDMFGEHAKREQLQLYAEWRQRADVFVIDGTAPVRGSAVAVFRRLCQAVS